MPPAVAVSVAVIIGVAVGAAAAVTALMMKGFEERLEAI